MARFETARARAEARAEVRCRHAMRRREKRREREWERERTQPICLFWALHAIGRRSTAPYFAALSQAKRRSHFVREARNPHPREPGSPLLLLLLGRIADRRRLRHALRHRLLRRFLLRRRDVGRRRLWRLLLLLPRFGALGSTLDARAFLRPRGRRRHAGRVAVIGRRALAHLLHEEEAAVRGGLELDDEAEQRGAKEQQRRVPSEAAAHAATVAGARRAGRSSFTAGAVGAARPAPASRTPCMAPVRRLAHRRSIKGHGGWWPRTAPLQVSGWRHV